MTSLLTEAFEFWEGRGAKKDPKKALALFEQGAKIGDADCQYFAGLILQDGLAGRFDRSVAFDYIEKAASQGHVDATYCLGYFYMSGGMSNLGYPDDVLAQKRIERDEAKGIELLKSAASQGHPHAILRIARFYHSRSKDLPESAYEAVEWYSLGIKQGDASCMVDMADMLILGLVVDQDKLRAKKLYQQAKRSKQNCSGKDAAIDRLKNFDSLESILEDPR